MKRTLVILVVAIGIVCLLGPSTLAGDVEVVGGYLYSTLDPQDLNETFNEFDNAIYLGDKVVDVIDFIDRRNYLDFDYRPDYIDDIRGTNGFYLGITKELADSEGNITLQYEKYNTGTEGGVDGIIKVKDPYYYPQVNSEYIYQIEFGANTDVDLDIEGLTFNLSQQLNKRLALNGGIGYYRGNGEVVYNQYLKLPPMKMAYYSEDEGVIESESLYKLTLEESFGWKVGATYTEILTEDIDFIANANYRHLIMDIYVDDSQAKENLLKELLFPNKNDFPEEEDFSGLELNVGLSIYF